MGDTNALKNVERSLTKLHDLTAKNCSIQDINLQVYTSPSNFEKVYNRHPFEIMKGKDSMVGVLNKVLSTKNQQHPIMLTIQPKDLRHQQINHINEMIREKKQQSPPLLDSAKQSSAMSFNNKRNETRDLV